MRFWTVAARGVAGRRTAHPRLSYSGLQETATLTLDEQLELNEAIPVERHD